MPPRFLQIHNLTSYPASLLNRDDAGFAKRMPFGGSIRTRISSQCLKRHWRVYGGDNSLSSIAPSESVRSRVSFERHVLEPLVAEGLPEAAVRAATAKIVGVLLGGEAKKEKAEKIQAKKKMRKPEEQVGAAAPKESVKTDQVTVLGKLELDFLKKVARKAVEAAGGDAAKAAASVDTRMKDKEFKKNLSALAPGTLEAGLGAALFGRMVTGDILARSDAAIHVAHALTVHSQMTESDYFSAIDDLVREEGEQGSGHINVSELTSGVYYGYVVVDVGGLTSNLGGDRGLAGEVVERLIHMVATVSPGAKKGSTAPYAYSHLVLVESASSQPRTLQNAFLEPTRPAGNIVCSAEVQIRDHLAELDQMYGKREARAHAGLGKTDELFENKMTLPDLASWAKERVKE